MNEADYVTWWQGEICKSINAEPAHLSPVDWIAFHVDAIDRYGFIDALSFAEGYAREELRRLSAQIA